MKDRVATAAAGAAMALLALAMAPGAAGAQSLQRLKNQPPEGAQLSFQLTDGTVLVQANDGRHFWVLTPDNTGSYVNGTWSAAAHLPSGYSPSAMASAVLADGRVLIEGGEYDYGKFRLTNMGAIYDPVGGKWTPVAPPANWPYIGDSPALVLPNGHFLLGEKLEKNDAELDPATLTWTETPHTGKADFNAEEGWTLMPDGTVLTVDVLDHPNSEDYNPATGQWTSLGGTVADLAGPPCCSCFHFPPNHARYCPPGEVGPAILRPDGTVFATGATITSGQPGHTAIYTPGAGWAAGPDFPGSDDAGDNFAVLLTNGDVLVQGTSRRLYDFNGTTLTYTGVSGAGGLLMVLPTGQILVNGTEVYNGPGTYDPAWQPTLSSYPTSVARGSTYPISGTQFNGLSQANAFGDEEQTATNYPLVRITNTASGHVVYARTHDHSTMAVATGKAIVSTNFDVPATTETGASSLVVVANGIPSAPVAITVQ